MKTLSTILGVAVILVLAVLGWSFWNSQNNDLKTVYPTEGSVLAGNSVPVKLEASQQFKDKISSTTAGVEVITYLNGKEVNRGKQLDYTVSNVPPGQYKLEVGLAQNSATGLNISLMPKPVNFTLGGGSGAVVATNPNLAIGNDIYALPAPIPANSFGSIAATAEVNAPVAVVAQQPVAPPVAVVVVPAQQPLQTAPEQLPVSGFGSSSRSLAAIAQPVGAAQPAIIIDGSQGRLQVSNNRISNGAVQAAQIVAQAKAEEMTLAPMFRMLAAFYLAAFIVGLGLMFVMRRNKITNEQK